MEPTKVFGTALPDGTQIFQWTGTGYNVSTYDTSIGVSPNNWYNGDVTDVLQRHLSFLVKVSFCCLLLILQTHM